MPSFRTPLKCTRDVGGEKFRLIAPLVYQSDIIPEDIIVPIGYETDFASIPQLCQWLIPQVGKHVHAAVVHDYLCTDGERLDVTQKQADQIFYEAMEVCGVRWSRRRLMFRSVRGFQRASHWITGKAYG